MVTVDVMARIDAALADAESQQPEWAAEPEGADGYVTWHGYSDDAANTEASDLDEDPAPCWTCGWRVLDYPDEDHDTWAAENEFAPHAYEAGNRPGDYVIARAWDWDLDGYCVPAEADEEDAVLLARCLRWERDGDGYCDELARGTAAELASFDIVDIT